VSEVALPPNRVSHPPFALPCRLASLLHPSHTPLDGVRTAPHHPLPPHAPSLLITCFCPLTLPRHALSLTLTITPCRYYLLDGSDPRGLGYPGAMRFQTASTALKVGPLSALSLPSSPSPYSLLSLPIALSLMAHRRPRSPHSPSPYFVAPERPSSLPEPSQSPRSAASPSSSSTTLTTRYRTPVP